MHKHIVFASQTQCGSIRRTYRSGLYTETTVVYSKYHIEHINGVESVFGVKSGGKYSNC